MATAKTRGQLRRLSDLSLIRSALTRKIPLRTERTVIAAGLATVEQHAGR
jgi:hypothetical protein